MTYSRVTIREGTADLWEGFRQVPRVGQAVAVGRVWYQVVEVSLGPAGSGRVVVRVKRRGPLT